MTSPRRKSGPRNIRRRSKWRVFWLSVLGLFTLAFIGLLGFVIVAVAKTPKWDPAALDSLNQSSVVYDMNGNQIAQLHAQENRLVAKSSDIPNLVKETFIAVEDKSFYQNIGIDPVRIVSSAIHDILTHSKSEGASTITVQLARNAFIKDPTQKTFTRKIQEVVLALELTHEYTKDEILTFYLNKIYLGESSFGIEAAAQTYFGTDDLSKLTPDQVALLAGLPQAPSGYDPYVHPNAAKYRRTIVLGVMRDAGLITAQEYAKYKDAPFTYVDQTKAAHGGAQTAAITNVNKFPYFVDYVVNELENTYHLTPEQIYSGGLRIYTTVDPNIQSAAESAFANPANFPQGMPDMEVEGAMTIVDPTTGSIRAMVGGRNYTPGGINRAYQAKRQPGSTIKPLVEYGAALEKGGYFPGTVLDDMPVSYNMGNGQVWSPTDYDTIDSGWKGLINMRFALEDSVNVYAVKLLDKVGVDYGWNYAKNKMGLPLTNSDKNLSLALGTCLVSPLDMASAYSVYADNGVRVTTHAVVKVTDSNGNPIVTPQITTQRVIKATTAYIMNDMLRSVVTNGTAYRAQIGNWAVAGKTGTTSLPSSYGNVNGNPDAWFVGYTPNYVGVVWMGYDKDPDGKHYLHQVYGGSYPAQIWKDVMKVALQNKPVQTQFSKPPGIVSGQIDIKSGLLPSSLTPAKFITTEIAAQGDFPTQVSNIWVQKQVDANNPSMLAGPYTKNTITKVFLNIPGRDPSIPWPASEAPYRPPTEIAQTPTQSTSVTPTTPSTQPTSTPPTGDSSIPTPSLGAAYESSPGNVTLPIIYPPKASKYSLIIYYTQPGQSTTETYTPDGSGKSGNITIPINNNGSPPAPGEYVFWAALQDPATNTAGPPSTSVKLNLTD